MSLVPQILKEKPSLKSFILSSEAEDEEEHFSDVPLEEDSDPPMVDGEGLKEVTEDNKQEHERRYRGLDRNPLYCRAEHSCLWELEKVSHTNHACHTHHTQPCLTHPPHPHPPLNHACHAHHTQPCLPHPPLNHGCHTHHTQRGCMSSTCHHPTTLTADIHAVFTF